MPSPRSTPSASVSEPWISVTCGAEAAVGELAVDDVEPGGQPIRCAIAQRQRQIEAHGAGAARRFEPREVLAEVARDQRRVGSRTRAPDRARRSCSHCSEKSPCAQIADADAQVGRAVAEHAAAAARREPRVDELERAVEILGDRPVADERELRRPRRRRVARNSPSPPSNGNARTGPTNVNSALVARPPRSAESSHATTVGGILFAGKYCGTAAMSNSDTLRAQIEHAASCRPSAA